MHRNEPTEGKEPPAFCRGCGATMGLRSLTLEYDEGTGKPRTMTLWMCPSAADGWGADPAEHSKWAAYSLRAAGYRVPEGCE